MKQRGDAVVIPEEYDFIVDLVAAKLVFGLEINKIYVILLIYSKYISRSSCPISTNLVSNERESHQLTILMNSFWKKIQNFEIFRKGKKGLRAGGTYA